MKKYILLVTLLSCCQFIQTNLKAQTLETDSLALLCVYIDYGGASWINQDNWLTSEPLSTWHGITVSSNRVTKIDLSDNNLVGAGSADFDNMNAINELNLSNNSITDIPSLLSMTSLFKLNVSDNQLTSLPPTGSSTLLDLICHNNSLDFGDLEPFVGLVAGNFQYAPQENLGKEHFRYFSENEDVTLTVDVDGNANIYFWLKDNQPVIPSPQTVPELTIFDATTIDEGAYVVEVTNSQLPDLTLTSNPIHLRQFVRDSLGGEYVPNHLIIEFTADATQFERDTMLDYYDAERLEICMCGVLELWLLPDTSITPQGEVIIGVEGVKENAVSKAKVEDADKNYLMRLLETQDNLTDVASYEKTNKPPAPDYTGMLDDLVPVALIDVGIDTTVSSIYPWLWTNENEFFDGVDNNEDCLIDDTRGYNFVDRNNAPMDAVHGHGTHLAGIISNASPIEIQLMNIQTHDENGQGLLFEATCAIYYAFQQGAKVINLSWGYRGEPVAVLENAIARAGEDCGALVVTSAGNETMNNDDFPHYPSSYQMENIISVAALNFDENGLLPESNFGLLSVDIAAPGDSILSNLPNPAGFGYKSGTSMAAAAVSRGAALLFLENQDATYLNVIDAIMSTAEPVATLNNIASGGRMDLDAALSFIQTVEPDTSCQMTVAVVAEVPDQTFEMAIYPQPFYDQVTIELNVQQKVSAQLIIVDAIGSIVFQKRYELSPASDQLIWKGISNNGTDLPSGLYFASLRMNDQQIGFKLLKM